VQLLVVGAHRAAHDDDGVEVVRVGRALAFVKLYAVYTRAAFAQDVLVDAGGLASDVLQHEHVGVEQVARWGRSSWHCGSAVGYRIVDKSGGLRRSMTSASSVA